MVDNPKVISLLKTKIMNNVLFQPPESIKISYPVLIVNVQDIPTSYANDNKYLINTMYRLTLIDKNPNSPYVKEILKLPYCSFDRSFVNDNLNHFVFNFYK